jgi:hypothetical protein
VSKHPFRLAIEGKICSVDLGKLFKRDVVTHTPILTKPVQAVENVLSIVGHTTKLIGSINFTREVRDAKQTILFWEGQIGGFSLQAATILVDDENGLIGEMRTLMRPWPVVTIFRIAMYNALSGSIPPEYWELQPKPNADGSPRKFTPIALKPIVLAANMTLHSPMLAESVHGKAEVEAALQLAHETQSPSSYTSIIASPDLLIEVFDCDADGFPMEGIWVQKINEQGQVYDMTVYLRPYPAVTVLRNRTKELSENTGALAGEEFWELPRRLALS